MIQPNALVLTAPGINCNEETVFALKQQGAAVEEVHISQLDSGDRSLDNYQILALCGGFSYGDHIASGRRLGLDLRTRHAEGLDKFVKAGNAVIGICNGFQVLVETGLIPDGEVRVDAPKKTSLAHNHSGRFESRWIKMLVRESTSKLVGKDLVGQVLELPVAHLEGRHVQSPVSEVNDNQISLQYVDQFERATEDYPENPNGSKDAVAAISSLDGNVLGMMPHPERFVHTKLHPKWHRGEGSRPFGAIIFKSLVNYVRET